MSAKSESPNIPPNGKSAVFSVLTQTWFVSVLATRKPKNEPLLVMGSPPNGRFSGFNKESSPFSVSPRLDTSLRNSYPLTFGSATETGLPNTVARGTF